MNGQKKAFNLEAVYDEKIAPLMTQIIAICKEHKLPMFASFLYAHDPEQGNEDYCTTSLMFGERPIPQKMLALEATIYRARSAPMLRMKVKNAAGQTIEETIVIPEE